MSENFELGARPADPVGRALLQISRILAIAGGVLCCAMAVMVSISVTGRYLFATPIPGDYDLLAIFTGIAVFAFLPYCQMVRGNVMVDFLTNNLSAPKKAIFDAIGTLLYLTVAVLYTWRLYFGLLGLKESNEVLANFEFYRWWTVPLNIVCMLILILVVLYTLVRDVSIAKRHVNAATGEPKDG